MRVSDPVDHHPVFERRTWRERLFSLPWQPWKRLKLVRLEPVYALPVIGGRAHGRTHPWWNGGATRLRVPYLLDSGVEWREDGAPFQLQPPAIAFEVYRVADTPDGKAWVSGAPQ